MKVPLVPHKKQELLERATISEKELHRTHDPVELVVVQVEPPRQRQLPFPLPVPAELGSWTVVGQGKQADPIIYDLVKSHTQLPPETTAFHMKLVAH